MTTSRQSFLLILLGLTVYSTIYTAPFVLDDIDIILYSPLVRSLALNHLSQPRYVVDLTFALNYAFGGYALWHYHLFNIMIHLACGLLVSLLTLEILPLAGRGTPGEDKAQLIAFFAGALFIVHPLQIQAVTYIVQRYTSLAALFSLAALLCYFRARRRESRKYLAMALGLALLAVKSKETAFTLPFVVIAAELLFFRGALKQRLLFAAPFLAVFLVVPLNHFGSASALPQLSEGMQQIDRLTKETSLISRHDYLLTEMRVIMTYLRLVFLPLNQTIDYDYTVFRSLSSLPVIASGIVLACIAALLFFIRKRQPVLTFGILWFFISLSLESSFIPIADVIMEHRLYLPLAGLAVAAAYSTSALTETWRKSALLILLLFCLAALTLHRNAVWGSEERFWSDAVEKAPKKMRPRANLGTYYLHSGRTDEAIAALEKALQTENSVAARYDLGAAYFMKGETEQAKKELSRVVTLANYPDAYNVLGLIAAQEQDFGGAEAHFLKAITLKPHASEVYANLGKTYLEAGELVKAGEALKRAIERDPDNAAPYRDLGQVLSRQGNQKTAFSLYLKALAMNPADHLTNRYIADYFITQKAQKKGAQFFTELSERTGKAAAHYGMGMVLESESRKADALRAYQRAADLEKDWDLPRSALKRLNGGS